MRRLANLARMSQGTRFQPSRLVAVTLACVALLATGCGGDDKKDKTQTAPAKANSTPTTRAQLKTLAKQVGHDIFWAGPKRGYTYELTRTKDGNIYIRYLPPGVPVGAASADFLSIGTYPQDDAFATIETARKRPGETVQKVRGGGGGVAVSGKDKPSSVYFAYPGSKILVEVYDPSPENALKLATSAKVKPIR
jgi:hypothetical protein